MEPKIEYAKTEDGVSIACAALGDGPAVVLSANLLPDIDRYTHGTEALIDQLVAAGRRVIFYDARGTGNSDRDALDVSLEGRLADLESVVGRLAVESFALVGRLHGGAAAIAYAVQHPEQVTHLALAETYVSAAKYYSATPYTRAVKVLGEIAEEDWGFFTLAISNFAVGFRDTERAAALAAVFQHGVSPEYYIQWMKVAEALDLSPFLPQLSVPTLVIRVRGSVLSDPGAARSLASAIPSAQSLVVGGEEEMNTAILEFTAGNVDVRGGTNAPIPSGTRTVLFTDLVGHTEMMQRLGDDKGRDVLREHDRITRETLNEYGGDEVKTMGDGFMASFGSVTRAMDCAIALQRAFARHSESMPEPLDVRVGLNAGEPIEEDGDLFGSTVILASRIAAQAGAGEILIPEPLRHLLSGKSYVYSDRGETVLKGFEDAVRLYEVRWEEL